MQPNPNQPKALGSFIGALDIWQSRFQVGELYPEGPNVDKTHERYQPFFRNAWAFVASDSAAYDETYVKKMLEDEGVRKGLLHESIEDTRDRVVRLHIIFERFLADLQEEVNGPLPPLEGPKGVAPGPDQDFGKKLYVRLEGATPPKAVKQSLNSNPVEVILPVLSSSNQARKSLAGLLDDLHFTEHGTIITEVEALPTWTDWHCFLYGVRCTSAHGKLSRTLGDHGCLPDDRRRKISSFLGKSIAEHKQEDGIGQRVCATDMIRLLIDMEYRYYVEELQKLKDPQTTKPWQELLQELLQEQKLLREQEFQKLLQELQEPLEEQELLLLRKLLQEQEQELQNPHTTEPWRKFLQKLQKLKDPHTTKHWHKFLQHRAEVGDSRASRTEFEVSFSYAVKLWMPRMMRKLAFRLVDVLKAMPPAEPQILVILGGTSSATLVAATPTGHI